MEEKINSINNISIKNVAHKLRNGSTPKGGNFEKIGVPYFRSQDFNLYELNINQYITNEFHQKIKRSEVKCGDILLAVVGATLGNVGYVDNRIKVGNINQNVCRIRIIDKQLNSKYLAIYLSSKFGKKSILRNATITTQGYINNQQLSDIKIPLPPKETQAQIVAIMDKAYALKKEKEEKAAQLLKSIDGYILEQLGIQLPEVKQEKTFIVYAKELEKSRADVYYHKPFFKALINCIRQGKYQTSKFKDFITNIHYGASVKNNYIDEGIPLLRILNLRRNEVDTNNIVMLPFSTKKDLGKAFVKEGDILISRSGSTGITSVVPKEANGFAFGSFMIKAEVKNINKNYLCFWLNNYLFQKIIERVRIGAIQGNITIPIIENFIIPLPPLEVQNQIAQEVQKRMKRASALKQQAVQALQQAKQEVENILFNP